MDPTALTDEELIEALRKRMIPITTLERPHPDDLHQEPNLHTILEPDMLCQYAAERILQLLSGEAQ